MGVEIFADLLVKRFSRSIPIDLSNIISKLDVSYSEENIPGNIEGIYIPGKGPVKPAIIIEKDLSSNRKRFTIAHEVGHHIIPWHIGCLPDGNSTVIDFYNFPSNEESEANLFASELLMPEKFIRSHLRGKNPCNKTSILSIASEFSVSFDAAAFRIIRFFNGKYFFVVTDLAGSIIFSNSNGNVPFLGRENRFDIDAYKSISKSVVSFDYYDRKYFFIEVVRKRLRQAQTSLPPSTEILRSILLRYNKENLFGTAQGIIGSANGKHKPTSASDLMQLLSTRFSGREDFRDIVLDREFHLFIKSKSIEIFLKQK